jgi:hypothetical protein
LDLSTAILHKIPGNCKLIVGAVCNRTILVDPASIKRLLPVSQYATIAPAVSKINGMG